MDKFPESFKFNHISVWVFVACTLDFCYSYQYNVAYPCVSETAISSAVRSAYMLFSAYLVSLCKLRD